MPDQKKILVVEDDAFTRDLYQEVLGDAGYEVIVANDGDAGLEKIKAGTYDLILLDMMLPKLDGLGILRALKNEPPKIQNGPIVLVTNLAHDPVIKLAKDLGVKDFIIKSEIDPGQLVEHVKGFLS